MSEIAWPDDLSWVNTSLPPALDACRGKAVLLYFWTSSSAFCARAMVEIQTLENTFEDGLVVLGVHVPKYPAERSKVAVLKEVNRLYVRHPVACDDDYRLWKAYGLEGWPAYLLLDHEGKRVGSGVGWESMSDLSGLIEAVLQNAEASGERNFSRTRTSRRPEPKMPVQFPSGVAVSKSHIFVSDTHNNRVLELKANGTITRIFGSSNPGFWDGTRTNAGFNQPSGLAVLNNVLYVADTGNHALRKIDLFSGDVTTLLGTGRSGQTVRSASGEFRDFSLHAPIGLAGRGTDLYVAVTGLQQVWKLDISKNVFGWLSGSGQFGIRDGEAAEAAFAGPMGLAAGNRNLFVADAEGNALRAMDYATGSVRTLVGRAPFYFGDRDGPASQALLAFPTALAFQPETSELWIADTFNNSLKVLNLRNSSIRTAGVGQKLTAPRALAVSELGLWIANTYAHEILRFHTTSGKLDKLAFREGSF